MKQKRTFKTAVQNGLKKAAVSLPCFVIQLSSGTAGTIQ